VAGVIARRADRGDPPNAVDSDDAAVICASLTEPERFGEIYDRHAVAVHRYIARRVGPSLADDLVAETFLAAFRGRRRYRPDAAVALPWLYGIATNLLRRHRRTELAQYRALQRTGVDPVSSDGYEEPVTARVVASEWTRALVGALARLTVRERDVVLLAVWGELSYEEVAAALQIPVGTVRSRLNRARRRLRALLDDFDPGRS
jgi:RNA polymerase sigma-70 factor (ECF subfamily)